MKKEQFLGTSLHTGLMCEVKEIGLTKPKVSRIVMVGTNCCVPMGMSVSVEAAYDQVIPIARPLSDLTKQITHNGETFVPIDRLGAKFTVGSCMLYPTTLDLNTNKTFSINLLAYSHVFQRLIEWHFNLMDESEPFIPVTDEFNPYK